MKKQWLAFVGLLVVAIVVAAALWTTMRSPTPRTVTVSPDEGLTKRLLPIATSRPATAADFLISIPDSGQTSPPRIRLYFDHPIRPPPGLPPEGDLAVLKPGTNRIDLADFPDGDHILYVLADGFIPQWRRVAVKGQQITNGMENNIALCPKKYVTVRWAFNTAGKPDLTGPDVVVGRTALSHFGRLQYFGMDWQLWQKDATGKSMFGDVPMLNFHRISRNMGFLPAPEGVTFDEITLAPPAEQYAPKSVEAKPGLLLYCRIEGNTPKPGDRGFGKILVESVSTTRPVGIDVREPSYR